MKNIIIGTAGHVDHGKTCLIKALTGIETDRLKEEQKRGITIDIGFAYMQDPNGEKIGIIDVPGHEKFVKNMLAGVGGIDMVMLMISAEEGMMPQTKEHLGILSVLNTKKGIVVITKADLVESDWLELTKEEIRESLKDTFLSDAPILEVSAYTGQGMDKLKETIYEMVETCAEKDKLSPNFRVPIDRVFTIDGFGTVITGTLIEGNVKVGDEAMIYPSETPTKIRNIQVHNQSVQTAVAGQRVAINLANIKKEHLMRGDVLAKKDSLHKTRMLDVNFSMIKDTERSLKNGDRVHFYYGTSELLAKAILLDKDSISSGESAYVQFRLEEEICLKPKDYMVARFYSPMETLGGGVVIDTNPKKHRRMKEDVLNALAVKQTGSDLQILEQIILEYSSALKPIDFIAVQYGKSKQDTIQALAPLITEQTIQKLTATVYVHKNYIQSLDEKTKIMLKDYHKAYPLREGMPKEEFRNKLITNKESAIADSIIAYLEKRQCIHATNSVVFLFDFQVTYDETQHKLKESILEKYLDSGFLVPELDEVLKLYKDPATCKQIINQLVNEQILIKLNAQSYMHCQFYNKAKEALLHHFATNEKITLPEYRDCLNISRKYTILLLDHFDEIKFTKNNNNERFLVN